MHINYPWRFDQQGRTAATTREDHVRDMIEQVLLTAPGERVNRPEFGAGLRDVVFDAGGRVSADAVKVTVHAALERWLADEIQLVDVTVDAIDAALHVTIAYQIRGLDEQTSRVRVDEFLIERQAP